MTDSVAELVKQARVLVVERGALTSNRLRQALNMIAKGPRIDKDAAGPTKFKAAMALRNLCLIYRGVKSSQKSEALELIRRTADLVAGLDDDPGAADRYYLRD